jgi:hypothetical protein
MMESRALSTGSHNYTKVGKPFMLGDRMVCMADEVMSADMNAATVSMRRVLLDMETGREIEGPLDLGAHVIHPEPGGAYTYHPVVEAEQDEQGRIS